MAKTPAASSGRSRRAAKRSDDLFREVAGFTDVGLVREGNEDAMLLLDDHRLYVVADGMGGHACGEVASAFTIEAMKAFYGSADLSARVEAAFARASKQPEEAGLVDDSPHGLRLRKAVESANISVYRMAQQHEQLRDMGTTVVAVAFADRRAWVANVGDSRAYLVRRKGHRIAIQQVTEDHSLLNEYIKMNLLGPAEIEAFPYKNVIVRALGLQEQVTVDVFSLDVAPGDQFLLCSDGLTDLVRDHELATILDDAPSAAAACHRLIDLAKERGGIDNITTVIVRLHERRPAKGTEGAIPPPPSSPPPSTPPPSEPAPSD
jgi:protein phosphatase